MNHPHKHRLKELAQEAIESAKTINYEHDQRNLEWDLTEESIVFEVGAYRGRWAVQIAERFNPQLYCFEPQVWAWDTTRYALRDYPNARVFNHGLCWANGYHMWEMSGHETDSASFVRDDIPSNAFVAVKGIVTTLRELDIDHIDLMLMNIEGYEHILIPGMLYNDICPKWLVVQFHNYDGKNKEPETRRLIEAQGYKKLWDYGSTLVAWEKKDE